MIKLKTLLFEKTFKISSDVDYVYNVGGFKDFLKKLKRDRNNFPHKEKILKKEDITFNTIDSDKLISLDARKSDLVNPIKITCGIFTGGSSYIPNWQQIYVSFNYVAIKVIADHAEEDVPTPMAKMFVNEITEHKIKSTISHELSHWISDSLYNRYLGKLVDRANELKSFDIMKLGKKDVDMTYFEINAYIHGIKELKRKFKSKWDQFSLDDLYNKYAGLGAVAKHLYKLYGQDILNIWQKMLVKRMDRENLLGKNMRSFVKGSEF